MSRMTPEMLTVIPPKIKMVLDKLQALNTELGSDAAAIISAFLAQSTPDDLTVCLSTNTVKRGGVTLALSPNQTVVFNELHKKYPSIVSVRELHRALWGMTADRSVNTVRVMMTDMRKRLHSIHVGIANHNGQGYRLDPQPITP
jgi:DNA-binding response OmpR family regulator